MRFRYRLKAFLFFFLIFLVFFFYFITQQFDMEVSDEFVEYVSEGSLAIEVWGNRMTGFDSHSKVNWNVEPQHKGLHDRYSSHWLSPAPLF